MNRLHASRPIDEAEMTRRVARFTAATRAGRLKLTPQRLEIFRVIAASLTHPDAESVHRAACARLPTVSLDTVYRTLWILTDLGLVSTLGVRREHVRFDANIKPHHHYVCVRCGLTRDFEHAGSGALRLPDSVRTFGSVLATSIEARGVCAACGKKTKKRKSTLERRPQGRKGRKDER